MEESARRTLVVTQGDADGIGPELLLRVAADGWLAAGDRVVASRAQLDALAAKLGEPWARRGRAHLEGLLVPDAPRSQVAALRIGVDIALADASRRTALVTAPIDKAACAAEGFGFPGHTEYLAHRAGVDAYCMAMIGPILRVALATIHIPLREVPARLSVESIEIPGRLLAGALRREFGIARPRVGVLGVNPHAGEGGRFGDEEERIVEPAVAGLSAWAGDAFAFSGPLPADTAFALHARGELDGLIAMYHDQGLAPFKLLHFSDGVNVTLGLPFVRTSPDHGTAKDIAGRGVADPASMVAAIRMARGGET